MSESENKIKTIPFFEFHFAFGFFIHEGFFKSYSLKEWYVNDSNKEHFCNELYKIPGLSDRSLKGLLNETYDVYIEIDDALDSPDALIDIRTKDLSRAYVYLVINRLYDEALRRGLDLDPMSCSCYHNKPIPKDNLEYLEKTVKIFENARLNEDLMIPIRDADYDAPYATEIIEPSHPNRYYQSFVEAMMKKSQDSKK